jgi:D-sedoheptulose 7-phosphate isomerase
LNRLDELYEKSEIAADFARGYLDYLSDVISRLDEKAIAAFIKILLEARERGARIFFLGNGGSAATASHFANDISIGSRERVKPFRAISLTDNVAVITAIGNDDGHDAIFLQQLETQMVSGDVVVAISASGNSPNVIKAIDYANAQDAITVGLTGFDGGQLAEKAALNVHIPTNKGEYGPAEDGHMILDHLVGSYLSRRVKSGGT